MAQAFDTNTEIYPSSIMKRIRGILTKDIEFPLKMIENRYPLLLDQEGWIRCPNCGDSRSLSEKLNRHMKCNTCFSEYFNYGVLGLEPIKIEK